MRYLRIACPVLALLLCGCVNLKQVSDFGTASAKGAANFQTLPYSFAQNCRGNCLDNDIRQLKLNKDSCDCSFAGKADSVDQLLYHSIKAYLDGLADLASGDLTDLKYDALTDQLQANKFDKVKITKEQAGAYSKLATLITKAVADGYRKNKLKEYIKTANPDLKIVADALEQNIAVELVQATRNRQIGLKLTYYRLLQDNSSSSFQKQQIIEEYYRKSDGLDRIIASLNTYGRLLQKIVEDHQQLYDHIEELSAKNTALQIAGYISDIKQIDQQIKIIVK